MTSNVVIGCIFFSGEHVVVVVELSSGAFLELVDWGWFLVEEESSGAVGAFVSFSEEVVG